MVRPDLEDWFYRNLKAGKDLHALKVELEAKGGWDDYCYERDQALNAAINRLKKEDPSFAFWWSVKEYQDVYLVAAIVLFLAALAYFSRTG
ncbi:MAG: hypothetical protein WC792_06020 [Candidatus Micrarchaeia archaeon]|jgi:hypothetical protein